MALSAITWFIALRMFRRSRITSSSCSLSPRRSASRDATNISICCGFMFISTHLLLVSFIYPYHSVRAPFGPFAGVRLLLRLSRGISRISFPPVTLCPLLTPAARWAHLAVGSLEWSVAAGSFSFVSLSVAEFGSPPVKSRSSDDAGGLVAGIPHTGSFTRQPPRCSGPPGVNTHLSVRKRRVYEHCL